MNALEVDFAPSTVEHGCMVDVRGIGVLIRGRSGVGKSETALGLIERGHSLVADDAVVFRAPEGGELLGTSKEAGRCIMEVRGLGFINVQMLYGVSAMRKEKRLDLVVTLKEFEDISEIERGSQEEMTYGVLDRKVQHMILPIGPGRDMVRMVEVAALESKLRGMGLDTAKEFNKKLLNSQK
jgi:HPr kinase/phosphorylase